MCEGKGSGMSEDEKGFRTLKGYDVDSGSPITKTMEDYLEMIYRICLEENYIRVNTLAERLHVRPSSASKMVSELCKRELIDYEKYGVIRLTEAGLTLGKYLLHRHNSLQSFFRLINGAGNELRVTEEVEHFIDKKTLKNIEKLTAYLKKENYRA